MALRELPTEIVWSVFDHFGGDVSSVWRTNKALNLKNFRMVSRESRKAVEEYVAWLMRTTYRELLERVIWGAHTLRQQLCGHGSAGLSFAASLFLMRDQSRPYMHNRFIQYKGTKTLLKSRINNYKKKIYDTVITVYDNNQAVTNYLVMDTRVNRRFANPRSTHFYVVPLTSPVTSFTAECYENLRHSYGSVHYDKFSERYNKNYINLHKPCENIEYIVKLSNYTCYDARYVAINSPIDFDL